jgi:hypothetical protein
MTILNGLDNQSQSYNLTGQILFGYVVNNNDPMGIQRLQVRIGLLHQGYQDAVLPWTLPIQNLFQGNAPGIGGFGVPVNGSKVAVYFPENDAVNTYWLGSSMDQSSKLIDFTAPTQYGWVDAAGNLFKVDTVSKTWTYNMVDGSYIQFSNGVINIVSSSSLNVNATGDCSIYSSGKINLTGTKINLNTGSNPASNLTPIVRETPANTSFSGQTDY